MNKTKRYFIGCGSYWFSQPDHIYDYDLFTKIVKENGGKNIRLSLQEGVKNTQKVICFTADDKINEKIKKELNKLPVFQGYGAGTYLKNW